MFQVLFDMSFLFPFSFGIVIFYYTVQLLYFLKPFSTLITTFTEHLVPNYFIYNHFVIFGQTWYPKCQKCCPCELLDQGAQTPSHFLSAVLVSPDQVLTFMTYVLKQARRCDFKFHWPLFVLWHHHYKGCLARLKTALWPWDDWLYPARGQSGTSGPWG